ncbi:uncharacterized protein B0T23DRAFT_130778 [Neurospora hispaniola]|uniref:Uncharacterized protein n=1 Tax=Neurospora hispaniola TaxID=588809 RepID=A0AAJ0IBP6_9PEZI|nr:hypothetical protein B0T23DRAFT_130778 [Neurospora hispaniola]
MGCFRRSFVALVTTCSSSTPPPSPVLPANHGEMTSADERLQSVLCQLRFCFLSRCTNSIPPGLWHLLHSNLQLEMKLVQRTVARTMMLTNSLGTK